MVDGKNILKRFIQNSTFIIQHFLIPSCPSRISLRSLWLNFHAKAAKNTKNGKGEGSFAHLSHSFVFFSFFLCPNATVGINKTASNNLYMRLKDSIN